MPAGFTNKAGFKREAILFTRTWPSAAAAEATRLIPLLTEDVNLELDQQSLVTRDSRSVAGFNKVIRQSVAGPVAMHMIYEGLEEIFTMVMGFESPRIGGVLMPEDINLDGSVYRHIIEVDRDLASVTWRAGDGFIAGPTPTGDGIIAGQQKVRRGTFIVQKNSQVWESRSMMVNTFTMQVDPQGVYVSLGLLGYDIDYDGAVNDDLDSLVCPDGRVLFRDCKLSVRVADGQPMGASDEIAEIGGFTVSVNNNLQAINTRDTGTYIDEPKRAGNVTITGSFSIPRWSSFDLLDANQTNSPLVMKLECIGDTIPGTTDNFQFTLWFSSVTLTGASIATNGPGQVLQTYSFMAQSGGSPIGFPPNILGGPMIAEFYNTDGSHTLID